MTRILTGIQSTGTPHLGNLLGAIIPAIELSKDVKNESLFFIADLHSFTTIRDKELLRENTYATAAAWLAFGFDTDKNLFYRQSDVTEVCELTWYLNCFTPFNRLKLAHSFIHFCFWNYKGIWVFMIESSCNISCHFQMLHLVFSHRNNISIIKQNISSHKHRISKQAGVHI